MSMIGKRHRMVLKNSVSLSLMAFPLVLWVYKQQFDDTVSHLKSYTNTVKLQLSIMGYFLAFKYMMRSRDKAKKFDVI